MRCLSVTEYYHVFLTPDNLTIVKKAYKATDELNSPERLVRIWNELHTRSSFQAQLLNPADGIGWKCPCINGVKPDDTTRSKALITIFESSGRIVLNAPEPNTFVLTTRGSVAIIDVKMALRIAPHGDPAFAGSRYRRTSDTSSIAWDSVKDTFSALIDKYSTDFPQTINTIKALLFIRMNRPKIFDVNFLNTEKLAIPFFAKALEIPHPIIKASVLSFLDTVVVPGRLFIGAGSYNKVYLCPPDGKTVLKTLLCPPRVERDSPARSVRIWDELNGSRLSPAKVVDKESWESSYITGKQASDEEMALELIKYFNATGRIVVDAISPENFLKTAEGQVICVDVDRALQLERRDPAPGSSRRKSTVSLNIWDEVKSKYPAYWEGMLDKYPQTINTIKTLLFIKENRPDICNANFLIQNPSLLHTLAATYDPDKKSVRLDSAWKLRLLDTAAAIDTTEKAASPASP